MDVLLNRIALLWAGVVLGGSLIAAPAKFHVEALSLPVALQVGRAQFLGVTLAEVVLLIVVIIAITLDWRSGFSLSKVHIILIAVIVLLAVQHVLLMPVLQARSDRIIADQNVQESHLHVLYVVVECAKVLLLLAAGFLSANVPGRQVNRGRQA